MLIPETYVLCNELAQKGNINISNFSNFVKLTKSEGIPDTILQYGNCTFINAKSPYTPINFLKLIHKYKPVYLGDKILASYITKEFECSINDLLKLKKFNPELIIIAGKKFIKFNKEFLDIIDKYVCTNISEEDYIDCKNNNMIIDGIKLSKNNYLVWY